MLLHFPAHQSPLEMENNTESYDEITDSLSTLLFHYSVLLLLFSHATKYCIAGVCLSVTDFIDALLSVCMRHVQRKTLCQFNSIGFLFSKTWFQTPGFVTAYFAPISLSFHSLLFWNIWIDFSIEKFLMDFCYTHVWSSIWYLLVLFKYSIIKWFKLYIDFFSSVWHWDNLFTNDRPTQLNSVSMTLLYNCDVGIFFSSSEVRAYYEFGWKHWNDFHIWIRCVRIDRRSSINHSIGCVILSSIVVKMPISWPKARLQWIWIMLIEYYTRKSTIHFKSKTKAKILIH